MQRKLVLLASFWFGAGCSGEGGSSTRDLRAEDAASSPEGDAARSDASDSRADAGEPSGEDAAIGEQADAAVEAGTVGAFSFQVLGRGAPLANVQLFLHDSDGKLLSEQRTDAKGSYSAEVAPAAITLGEGADAFMTFLGLSAGDHVVAMFPTSTVNQYSPAFLASYPTPPAQATTLVVLSGRDNCGYGELSAPLGAPVSVDWWVNCPRRPALSLLAWASDQDGEALFGYSFGSGLSLPASWPGATVLGPWQAPSMGSINVSNIPADWSADGQADVWADGVPFATNWTNRSLPVGSTARAASYPYPAGFGEALGASISVANPANNLQLNLAQRHAVGEPNFQFNLSDLPLGTITVQLDSSTPSRTTFRWAGTGVNTPADGVAVRLNWLFANGAEGVPTEFSWIFVAPPGTTQVRLPELPAPFSNVVEGAMPGVQSVISYFDSSIQQGYREFLSEPVRVSTLSRAQVLTRELSQVGVARASTWYPQ